jgi:hypothetical protein
MALNMFAAIAQGNQQKIAAQFGGAAAGQTPAQVAQTVAQINQQTAQAVAAARADVRPATPAEQAAYDAAHSSGGILGALGSLAGPVQSALSQTPLAPFAGAVTDLAKGDYKAAAADAAAAGVEIAIQATPLGDVPVLGQIVEAQAGSFVKNMIQGQTPQQAATVAAATATRQVAQAVVSGTIPGVSLPVAPAVPSQAGTAGAPPGMRAPDSIATAVAQNAVHTQDVLKPYGKTFKTRSAWESFAMRPETAGGTIGFPGQ